MSDSCVLDVGTEVSAKYRGAFCEATIKHVKKLIKIRISWNKPLTGSATVTQENIRGVIKVQSTVEAKRDNVWSPATVLKITDASTYTVVFDDGDERTLGRNSVCPQGAKHFNEEWTLDHLPLTNPENFGTPVILESKKQRKRRKVDGPDRGRNIHYSEEDVGKVAFYDTRSKKQTLLPVLIASHSQCDEFIATNPGEVIVRSFKSGKFMSIPKEDMLRFDRDTEPLQSILNNTSDIVVMKPALEKALAFYDTGVLPLSWESETDSHVRLKDPENLNNTKLKKQFTLALHEYWEKKGSPITRQPSVGYHDLDLYQLHCYVSECGGPDTVTQNMRWRSICAQMSILNLPPSGSHTVKNAYTRYVVPFLDGWEGRAKRRSGSVSENVSDDTPVPKKKGNHGNSKGRVNTPVSFGKGRRTPTPCGKGRRNSVKIEQDGESAASSDNTDYEQMPAVHKYAAGQRVKVLYGAPKHCGSYEAKINDRNIDSRTDLPVYHIHYTGWNTRYDEWVTEESILSLVTRSNKKKGTLLDPPKDVKSVPNRRKIVPKYKRYKKQQSATSETSSDDKNSLPASECSETELEKQVDQPEIKEEQVEESPAGLYIQLHEIKKEPVVTGDVTSSQPTQDGPESEEKSPLLCEESFDDLVETAVSSTQPQAVSRDRHEVSRDRHDTPRDRHDTPRDRHDTPRDRHELSRDRHDMIRERQHQVMARESHVTTRESHVSSRESHVSSRESHVSSRESHVMTRDHESSIRDRGEEDKAKEEAAAILMTFPSTFAMKGGAMTGPGQVHTAQIATVPHTAQIPASHLHFTYQYPPGSKTIVSRMPVSPSKDMYITTSGVPTQYLTTNSVRPVMAAAGIAKIPGPSHVSSGTQSAHYGSTPHNYTLGHQSTGGFTGNRNSRLITKSGSLVVVTDAALQSNSALQSNINSMIKLDEKKKGRKRKIQQADSTSDIGSRLQQFDFRPDPCEDCDKRADERPRRAERDKARRGTVKNSEGNSKLTSGERNVQQPPYWIPGSVVGNSYVRGSAVPLYYTGSDIIQGGYYVPMRPPGIGPYPPGYTPKFPIPIPKCGAEKDVKSSVEQPGEEQPSSSGIRESTLAEPDSTVSDEKPPPTAVRRGGVEATPPHSTHYNLTPPYTTPPYCRTPPHTDTKLKSTPNIDSDSSDEKTTVPGMSPMILTHSTSDGSDKEGTSAKVKIFDKDFGIHLFDHLELPDKIRSMQSTMAELQKCYLFYKSQIAGIEKKEREKRKSKKRRKSKQRTSSISKSEKFDKATDKSEKSTEKLEKSIEKSTEKSAEKSTEKSAEKSVADKTNQKERVVS